MKQSGSKRQNALRLALASALSEAEEVEGFAASMGVLYYGSVFGPWASDWDDVYGLSAAPGQTNGSGGVPQSSGVSAWRVTGPDALFSPTVTKSNPSLRNNVQRALRSVSASTSSRNAGSSA